MPTMPMKRALAVAACCGAVALPAIAGPACTPDGGHACGDLTCADQATVDLQSASGEWVAGTYELALVADGNSASCALRVPSAPSASTAIDGACTSSLGFRFAPEPLCEPALAEGSADSAVCSPVRGAFHAVLTLPGKPSRLAFTLTRDGRMLLEQTTVFAYVEVQPNGPACAPTCPVAAATYTVGDDGAGDGGPDARWPAEAADDSPRD